MLSVVTHQGRRFGSDFWRLANAWVLIGDRQLNLVGDLFHAQNDPPRPARKGMLDGIRRKFID